MIRKCEEKSLGQKSEQGFGERQGEKCGNIERDVFKDSEVKRKRDFHYKTLSRQN